MAAAGPFFMAVVGLGALWLFVFSPLTTGARLATALTMRAVSNTAGVTDVRFFPDGTSLAVADGMLQRWGAPLSLRPGIKG